MEKRLLCLFFIGWYWEAQAQIVYSGFVDKFPIELIVEVYSDGPVEAIYSYTNFDTPIEINGDLKKGVMTLFEKDIQGKNSATLTFSHFDPKSQTVNGTWKNLLTNNELKITLQREFEVGVTPNKNSQGFQLTQGVSMKTHYFKIVLTETGGYPRVTGLRLYEKKTDEPEQSFDLDCQPMGFNSVTLGDFNFDGYEEFAVFETSYSGANTSSVYFLYNPKTKKFAKSEFTGTSLSFDPASKTITESNSCCAGSKRSTSVYKVVDNKMVLIEQHCFIWDEAKGDLVERKLSECN